MPKQPYNNQLSLLHTNCLLLIHIKYNHIHLFAYLRYGYKRRYKNEGAIKGVNSCAIGVSITIRWQMPQDKTTIQQSTVSSTYQLFMIHTSRIQLSFLYSSDQNTSINVDTKIKVRSRAWIHVRWVYRSQYDRILYMPKQPYNSQLSLLHTNCLLLLHIKYNRIHLFAYLRYGYKRQYKNKGEIKGLNSCTIGVSITIRWQMPQDKTTINCLFYLPAVHDSYI